MRPELLLGGMVGREALRRCNSMHLGEGSRWTLAWCRSVSENRITLVGHFQKTESKAINFYVCVLGCRDLY